MHVNVKQTLLKRISSHPDWDDDVKYFLTFHRERINQYNYHFPSDVRAFCTQSLFALAEECLSLRYAMTAFSVLVYSVHVGFTTDHLSIFRRYYESVNARSSREGDPVENPITRAAYLLVMERIEVCR
jgi:hypothetical protein